MGKFRAQILDPTLLSWLQKDQLSCEKEKQKVFGSEITIGEQRHNVWLTIARDPSDEELSIGTEIESMKNLLSEINYSFRHLCM